MSHKFPLIGVSLILASSLVGTEVAHAGEPRRSLRNELTPELRLSVERGFRFLVRQQQKSGSYSRQFPVAIDALAGLAFLAGGHSNRVGPFADNFQRGVNHLLSLQSSHPDGYFKDKNSRMYGHGFATLFLAELYGMTGYQDERIGTALKRAVLLIERSQGPDGGWDYEPNARGESDTSITVCQTMALRAARNLGIAVNISVIHRAKNFIEKAQNSDGGFAYRLGASNNLIARQKSYYPRSAAGVCILLSLGDYSSKNMRRGVDYLMSHYNDLSAGMVFPFYGDYYCTQALFHAGGRYWREYFTWVRAKLLRKQRPDGSWVGGLGGPEQSTAMALIILQTPYRYLPISER